jgi:cytochrome P450
MTLEERKGLVEEMLRWTTVTMHFRRTLTRDVELNGKTLREGRQGGPLVLVGEL